MSEPKTSQEAQETQKDSQDSKPRFAQVISGANELSLGISIVVAILLGIGLGIGLKKLTDMQWLFWLGVVWGVAAAILNIYKAYQRQQREAKELANDPRYTYKPNGDDDED